MQLMHLRAAGFSAAVDGCARDGSQLWFLSMLGSQQAIRAIWARLIKGEAAELAPGEHASGQSCWLPYAERGTFRFHGCRLPATGSYQGMIVPEAACYLADRPDFVLLVREGTEPLLHYRFLSRRIDLPMHSSWAAWLWERGTRAGEITRLDAIGVDAYYCRPDAGKLQDDVSEAVRSGLLSVSDDAALEEEAA